MGASSGCGGEATMCAKGGRVVNSLALTSEMCSVQRPSSVGGGPAWSKKGHSQSGSILPAGRAGTRSCLPLPPQRPLEEVDEGSDSMHNTVVAEALASAG